MCDCPKENNTGTVRNLEKCFQLPAQRNDFTEKDLRFGRSSDNSRNKKIIVRSESQPEVDNEKSSSLSTSSSFGEYSEDSSQTLCDERMESKMISECVLGCEEEECICTEKSIEEELDFEQTLAIIKPEVMENLREIENIINEEGFETQRKKYLRMTSEQVSEFYSDRYGTNDFIHFVTYMTSGPIAIQVLAAKNAIEKWQFLMGPEKVADAKLYFPDSVRGKFGKKSERYVNAVHGSATRKDAEREIHFFFPEFIVEPLLDGKNVENYLKEVINSFLTEALVECCKIKPADPILWLANWLLSKNPNIPKII